MPTNLPPEYYEVEKRYRTAKTTEEKISVLKELMSTIPKHKGTDKLRADLRRRLAKLKESAQKKKKTGGHPSLFYVEKEGAGRVVLVGPPNTGKSTLLTVLTNATPKVADSPYTTWSPTPGMMEFEYVQIQLIDTPPMSREHVEPELLDLVRTSDLILIVIDLLGDPLQQLTETTEVLMEHKIFPRCVKSRNSTEPHSTLLPCLIVVNKTDHPDLDEDYHILCELLEDNWPVVGISARNSRNLDQLKQQIYRGLGVIRVYSKPPGKEADFTAPFVLKIGSTVEEFAGKVHKDFLEKLKMARLWGQHVYDGQPVGRDHVLEEGDVVELHR